MENLKLNRKNLTKINKPQVKITNHIRKEVLKLVIEILKGK